MFLLFKQMRTYFWKSARFLNTQIWLSQIYHMLGFFGPTLAKKEIIHPYSLLIYKRKRVPNGGYSPHTGFPVKSISLQKIPKA